MDQSSRLRYPSLSGKQEKEHFSHVSSATSRNVRKPWRKYGNRPPFLIKHMIPLQSGICNTVLSTGIMVHSACMAGQLRKSYAKMLIIFYIKTHSSSVKPKRGCLKMENGQANCIR